MINITNNRKKNKLIKLIDESIESYYWLGFLMADGHFSKGNRLTVCLSIKDKSHLESLKNFIGCGKIIDYKLYNLWVKDGEYSSYKIMDSFTIPVLKDRYNIVSNKTYNPPNLYNLIGENKLAFAIGFIDGDGSIINQHGREDCSMRIKSFHLWKDILEFLFETNSKINQKGYVELCISDNEILRKYKRFALKNNLPIMSRKWDKININLQSRYVGSKKRIENIIYLKKLGMQNIDIASQLDISDAYVCRVIKERHD